MLNTGKNFTIYVIAISRQSYTRLSRGERWLHDCIVGRDAINHITSTGGTFIQLSDARRARIAGEHKRSSSSSSST